MTVSTSQRNLPNYGQLVKFLFQPFLNSPESLNVDCEYMPNRARVWIRVAFSEGDRATVLGRGGRNIYAIRSVLEASAAAVGQSVYLDIYGGTSTATEEGDGFRGADNPRTGDRPHRGGGGRRPPRGGGRYGGGGGRGGDRYRPR